MKNYLTPSQLTEALNLRDLSNPAEGPHAMQRIVENVHDALLNEYDCSMQSWYAHPLVSVKDNYDALGYPPDGPARESRYSRYLNPDWMLRTQTSSFVPQWLRSWTDKTARRLGLISCGRVYRRDSIDRLHTGEPHQMDLWILIPRREEPDGDAMLKNAIYCVAKAALPHHPIHLSESPHPYTEGGLQLDALSERNELIEIGECGRIAPDLLERCGWDPAEITGVAMGLGLDRVLMLRKHLTDIRLLRSEDPRIQSQMRNLDRWKPVSYQPPIERDLSIATHPDLDVEVLGDQIREALPDRVDWLESVRVLDQTPGCELPDQARERLGMKPGQKNVLVRLTIRHPTRSISRDEANGLRNQVYQCVHKGERVMLAE